MCSHPAGVAACTPTWSPSLGPRASSCSAWRTQPSARSSTWLGTPVMPPGTPRCPRVSWRWGAGYTCCGYRLRATEASDVQFRSANVKLIFNRPMAYSIQLFKNRSLRCINKSALCYYDITGPWRQKFTERRDLRSLAFCHFVANCPPPHVRCRSGLKASKKWPRPGINSENIQIN